MKHHGKTADIWKRMSGGNNDSICSGCHKSVGSFDHAICSCGFGSDVEVRGKNPICKRAGCGRQVFIEQGRVHDYCGATHAREAMQPQNSWFSKILMFGNLAWTYLAKYWSGLLAFNFTTWIRRLSSAPPHNMASTNGRRNICLWIDVTESKVFCSFIKKRLGLESEFLSSQDLTLFSKRDVRIAVKKGGSREFLDRWQHNMPNVPLLVLAADQAVDQDDLFREMQSHLLD
eukprot:TRINITY_DN8765_c0_g1_i1.p1 TRINITY_DN8765_c0_g1~~TRINITY_DN8765_c0_g1_i1.p1  ORF type:complete len:231 (-),score=34.39 TRINITY_DN8765_c0_g1_i1:28-720(-)